MRDRQLTVSYSYQPPMRRRPLRYGEVRRVPYLRLRGQWLEAAGFEIGSRVRVEIAEGQLTVRVEEGL